MLLQKIFQSFLFLILVLHNIDCDSCKEDGEFKISCSSYSDLLTYKNPGRLKSAKVSILETFETENGVKELFMCDESTFQHYSALKYLDMTKSRVVYLSANCFKGLDNLESIKISDNELSEIDMNTFRVSEKMQIRNIDLINNKILDIDLQSVNLPDLTSLKVTNNSLTSFYLKSENVPKIVNLDLAQNYIWRFTIESLTLTYLDLSFNCIKAFNKGHLALPSLKRLHLEGNHLSLINEGMFENMPKLQYVHLNHNLLHTVSLSNLNLVFIDINYNQIKTLDRVNLKFRQHSSLHLNFNKVFEMMTTTEFGNLTELICNFCNIHTIELYFVDKISSNLESLSLRSNLLTSANFSKQDKKVLI
ncbi:hypothetical protein DMENIID0001_041160 [Sergentomyia squamirostris]